jgi:hypothetical protein
MLSLEDQKPHANSHPSVLTGTISYAKAQAPHEIILLADRHCLFICGSK